MGFRQVSRRGRRRNRSRSYMRVGLRRADLRRMRMTQAMAFARGQNSPLDVMIGRLFESVLSHKLNSVTVYLTGNLTD
jgi:hypothetical protein